MIRDLKGKLTGLFKAIYTIKYHFKVNVYNS